jgi:hypothetical protein
MATRNSITGDEIKSKPLSVNGRDNWENIFGKKTGLEWAKINNVRIIDPDGWRENDGVDLDTPITKSDYNKRISLSTVMMNITQKMYENL